MHPWTVIWKQFVDNKCVNLVYQLAAVGLSPGMYILQKHFLAYTWHTRFAGVTVFMQTNTTTYIQYIHYIYDKANNLIIETKQSFL